MLDLHLHLDGSLNPQKVPFMAQMSGIELNCSEYELKNMLVVEPDCTNLAEYLVKFDLPLKLLQTKECIEYAVYELMRELDSQGLCYAEIRFAPQLHKQRNLSQEEVVQAAVKGLNRGNRDFLLFANLILCCMRGDNNEQENINTIDVAEKYLKKGVCAVDLAGNEAAFPTKKFNKIFAGAVRKGVPVIIHAGEAAGPDSIHQAIEMGAVRIGHGIHAIEDVDLLRTLKEKNIYLEMCYTSNLQTKTVDKQENYPIVKFLENGLGVTLNTDNMTVSDTTLKEEYKRIQKQFLLDEKDLLKIALNSVQAAFLPEDKKEYLKLHVLREFSKWFNE